MREELIRLEEQVRRAFEGGAWHGPSVLETLADIPAEAAAARLMPRAHSIWEIVLHVTATYRLVLKRIHGQPGNLSDEEDWPSLQSLSESDWRAAVDELQRLNREVRAEILAFDASKLDEPLADGHVSAYVHFAGLPQHDAYHAGQLALLRKALANAVASAE
jgi:uncharacterized damage-inducible protein DinB